MAFLVKLITVAAFVTVARSRSTTPETIQDSDDSYGSYLPNPNPAKFYAIPLDFQLPKAEPPKVPFYAPEPSTDILRVPQYYENPEPDYYNVPIPSQDLRAPTEYVWNPENDPKLYYELPALLTRQEIPTDLYPKKFNKEIHVKSKPYVGRPKEEITVLPIDEKQYQAKDKSINKKFNNLAKQLNQKQIEEEKVQRKLALKDKKFELQGAESGFGSIDSSEDSVGDFSQGLSAKITASLGIPHSPSHGERLEFHLTGHDGPHSYKWGYDTGKGHNRQFRYEEKDKEGIVNGHFGFYDKNGKLKMVNYDSHPLSGYHAAEGNTELYS